MSFADWLNALGGVVTHVLTWIGQCFDILKSNYIILTILGIALFFFIWDTVMSIINWFDKRSIENYEPKHAKGQYKPKHGKD